MTIPLPELDLLKRWANHREFAKKLHDLALVSDIPKLESYIEHIARAWFELGTMHLRESTSALHASLDRATYSRSYYAVYNQSKAIRFYMSGSVSLKGDDHQKCGELPGDFPDADPWSRRIGVLYQHRLSADYDNWSATTFSLTSVDANREAIEFDAAARGYFMGKGLSI